MRMASISGSHLERIENKFLWCLVWCRINQIIRGWFVRLSVCCSVETDKNLLGNGNLIDHSSSVH